MVSRCRIPKKRCRCDVAARRAAVSGMTAKRGKALVGRSAGLAGGRAQHGAAELRFTSRQLKIEFNRHEAFGRARGLVGIRLGNDGLLHLTLASTQMRSASGALK